MRAKVMFTAAALAYILAWFLPTVYLPDLEPWSADSVIVTGWEATRAALGPIWRADGSLDGPLRATLAVASGLSNLLFVVAVLFAFWRPSRIAPWLPWAIAMAALINTHWLVGDPGFRSSLSAGYYLWLASFVLLTIALFWQRGPGHAANSPTAA